MWQETKEELYQKFVFDDFKQAFDFMTKVAAIAEKQQHHPRWSNEWNTVEIWLSTHDAGGKITDKDRELAKAIDEVKI
jgi:4a-hydroxytetrahydrobiopterin dehydratase